MSFVEGFIIGLGMIIFVGPVFFLLLNSSLQYGTKAGTAVAIGIIISDVFCVLLCYFGLTTMIVSEAHQFWIGVAGTTILFGLGIHYLFKKQEGTGSFISNGKDWYTFLVKGFSVNFFNPFVFVVWMSVFQYGKSKYSAQEDLISYLIAVLVGIFFVDLLKVFLSKKLRNIISKRRLNLFFKITGVVLILFSFRILYRLYQLR